jgi:hypothetical protein
MSNCGQSALNALLEKNAAQCDLRNILERHGIPENESIEIHIESGDEIIASYNIPSNSNSKSLVQDRIAPLNDLRTTIVEFLNQGQDSFGLLEEIKAKTPQSSFLKVRLNIGKNDFEALNFSGSTVTFAAGYKIPCPPDRPICAI